MDNRSCIRFRAYDDAASLFGRDKNLPVLITRISRIVQLYTIMPRIDIQECDHLSVRNLELVAAFIVHYFGADKIPSRNIPHAMCDAVKRKRNTYLRKRFVSAPNMSSYLGITSRY